MKRSRAYKTFSDWKQREMRMLIWALSVGIIAAAAAGLTIWYISRNGSPR
jgi:hypothetical protein